MRTGDCNGDGMSRVLWIDNSGNVEAWLMNGARASSKASFTIGANWSVQALNAE